MQPLKKVNLQLELAYQLTAWMNLQPRWRSCLFLHFSPKLDDYEPHFNEIEEALTDHSNRVGGKLGETSGKLQ